MKPPPTSSLVIATYNWPDALRAVLESVRAQRVPPTEVVIADDGSGEQTAAPRPRVPGIDQGAAPRTSSNGDG